MDTDVEQAATSKLTSSKEQMDNGRQFQSTSNAVEQLLASWPSSMQQSGHPFYGKPFLHHMLFKAVFNLSRQQISKESCQCRWQLPAAQHFSYWEV